MVSGGVGQVLQVVKYDELMEGSIRDGETMEFVEDKVLMVGKEEENGCSPDKDQERKNDCIKSIEKGENCKEK